MAYCQHCGAQTTGTFCPSCGRAVPPSSQATGYGPAGQPVVVNNYAAPNFMVSPKSRLVALLLCFFLGVIGAHRFYVGKVGTGILWLFTAGFLGVAALIDLIMIIAGSFKDGNGLPITDWNN